jgi:hypothetical protein
MLLASWAGAHEIRYPKRDKLAISPTEIRVVIEYSVSREDARMLRQILRRPITDYLVQQATHFVVLAVDGEKRALKTVTVVGLDEGVRVELSAEVNHPRQVHFQDRHKNRHITVPVEVVVEGLKVTSKLPPQPVVFADHPLDLDLK